LDLLSDLQRIRPAAGKSCRALTSTVLLSRPPRSTRRERREALTTPTLLSHRPPTVRERREI
jgi:hypothetical protein